MGQAPNKWFFTPNATSGTFIKASRSTTPLKLFVAVTGQPLDAEQAEKVAKRAKNDLRVDLSHCKILASMFTN